MTVLETATPCLTKLDLEILAVSEDTLEGFQRDPIGEISQRTKLPIQTVATRIQMMMRKGIIRRVRQTLRSERITQGTLLAWDVPESSVDSAFGFLLKHDPFTGHIVTREAEDDAFPPYSLWTTLRVPVGFSLSAHIKFLKKKLGARNVVSLPARGMFRLSVGHIRRRSASVGALDHRLVQMAKPRRVRLDEMEWNVLRVLKQDFQPEEITPHFFWKPRAAKVGMDLETFYTVAENLARRGVLGRFTTVLEHAKPLDSGEPLIRQNALLVWAVEPGWEERAGCELGRFSAFTHLYWRKPSAKLSDVNIMGMVHGQSRQTILRHKAMMDEHLSRLGISYSYTTVFWSQRSEIRPSEIEPDVYRAWAEKNAFA